VIAKDGLVSAQAQAAFEQALKLDRVSPKARFYLARAAEQDGQIEKAKGAYADLLATSPADAPWASAVRQQLTRLGASEAVAGQGGEPQIGAGDIARMVSGLAGRLEAQGGTAEEWARLMRSYVVLGQRDKALAAARRARQVLAQDDSAVQAIDMMARDLKLTDAEQ